MVLPGDQVWVLAGASAPIILQPTLNTSELLYAGDAFILDHTHGEILGDRYEVRDDVKHIRIV